MKIGILGGGQLARMLCLAGYPLGMRFRVFDPALHATAGHLAEHVVADFSDTSALDKFADGLDVITYEFENVPVETVAYLAKRVPVHPSPDILAIAQDRWSEKECFKELGIPTPPVAKIDSLDDLRNSTIPLPAVLKTRRLGYDGKGQVVIRSAEEYDSAWKQIGKVPCVLEGFVAFKREVSVLAVRSVNGDVRTYPLVENQHSEGILRLSTAPAANDDGKAAEYARRIAERFNYVGVLAIEFFDLDGQLLANEMAPRVHNSGHWTIEGAETSQFENHVRAVAGLPLGVTAQRGHAAMLNVIGTFPSHKKLLGIDGVHVHDYAKSPATRRKIGHLTVITENQSNLNNKIATLRSVMAKPGMEE